ncbi:MAG: carboxyl-terminal protease [Bacteroidetes bacterium]|nr:MAG: carboxyl-terminal protease [Bacteroidota bacterium]
MKLKRISYLLLVAITILFNSCTSDPVNPEIDEVSLEDIEIQNFMWRSMNLWYYWQSRVPDLADSKIENTSDYLDYLNNNPDPQNFIESLLDPEDRFTFYSDDYTELTNTLSGISKSNGLEFGLVLEAEDSDKVILYTKYTIKNSDAERQGVQRGDLFNRVNGTPITTSNYVELLFSTDDSYTLGRVEYIDGDFVDNEDSVLLTKEENLAEHPIYLDTIFSIEDKKVGYLMYNAFIANYDTEVMAVFDEFQSNGVNEVVLDLRYNSGGATASARKIASRIYNATEETVFARQDWNEKWNEAFGNQLEDYFDTEKGINLQRVFILTETTSASASELLINGLDPHMQVIHIGDTTRGKNEFSITLVDDVSGYSNFPFLYHPSREPYINSNVSWALQPLVGRYENSVGFSDYITGLVPDIIQSESVLNMGQLGSITEPLLAKAIEQITGVVSSSREAELLTVENGPKKTIEFKRPYMDVTIKN